MHIYSIFTMRRFQNHDSHMLWTFILWRAWVLELCGLSLNLPKNSARYYWPQVSNEETKTQRDYITNKVMLQVHHSMGWNVILVLMEAKAHLLSTRIASPMWEFLYPSSSVMGFLPMLMENICYLRHVNNMQHYNQQLKHQRFSPRIGITDDFS